METEAGWRVDARIKVGPEPYGIVASENGKRVYVAVSLADQVLELDGRSREPLRRFKVPDEPRWLALHPSERALFVGSHRDGTVSRIDLREGTVHPIELPNTSRDVAVDGEVESVDLTARVTGDLAVTPTGDELAVPALYVDNVTSVDSGDDPSEDPPSSDGYGSTGVGVSRTNPALVTVALDKHGELDGRPQAILLAAQGDPATREGAVLRSYPSSVTAAPNNHEYLVSLEASDALLVVRRAPFKAGSGRVDFDVPAAVPTADTGGAFNEDRQPFTSALDGGFVERPVLPVLSVAGPRGVTFIEEEEAHVHGFLDRELANVHFDRAHDAARELAEEGFRFERSPRTASGRRIAKSALPEAVEAGRRLFFSATDSRMAGSGAGVSCSTCHSDGRNDGLTWVLNGQPRQTPSLAGPVHETAPVTWSNEVESVAKEALLTTTLRMGGEGPSAVDAANLEAYIAWTRYPDVADAGRDDALVQLGRELFHRADVGCAECHAGSLFTDNRSHLIIGDQPTQTPTLRGISATPPYLHDGSAPTLRAVLQLGANGTMGDISGLTEHEVDALEAYLRTL